MCILQSLKCFAYGLFTNNTLNEMEYHSTTHGILALIGVSLKYCTITKLYLKDLMANLYIIKFYNKTGSYGGGMAVYKAKIYLTGHKITAGSVWWSHL